ncbi:MAG: PhaM family polyhydroxyalkanoate granule multifunctional regulatory protein [Burkholderiales bacterium]
MATDNRNPDPAGAPAGPFPFSPSDALDFMQRMWNPLGIPMPGFGAPTPHAAPAPAGLPFPNPAAMFAALDPAEVERKIGELKIIENWLTMSLSMMQMSIKTLELQKASLEAMRGTPRGDQKSGK